MGDEMITQLGGFVSKEILKEPARAIQPDEALISSGLINSFSLVDLALFVEDAFGVIVADTELNASSFDTLEQLAALIRSRM